MKDLMVVTAKRLLQVFQVSPIRGFDPPSILVRGQDVGTATEVYFNGVPALEFAVSSRDRLIVRIPPSEVGKKMDDLQVVSEANISRQDTALSLEVGKKMKSVEGLDRLIQSWMMVFMSSPGSDIFSPKSGGGGMSIVGRTTDHNGKGVTADLAVAVERTKSEIIRLQSANPRVPPSEKLLSCSLDQVVFDDSTGTLLARVSLKNMLGEQAQVSIR